MTALAAYSSLFLVSVAAATILPLQSEAVLSGLILTGDYSVMALVAVASFGNTLGAVVNWALGRSVERFQDRKWFPVKPAQLEKAARWYSTYGRWTLLLSWVPIIGDPLTVAAGVMRERLGVFILLVGFAKTARYIALAYLFSA